tara:strand:- start:24 stop:293 length:270 start_codon:yes stop_codon:yes gene_type:complete
LHIDSYKKIQYINGHKINLINVEELKIEKKKLVKNFLWFVNIGEYNPTSMQEKNEFGLLITSNKLEAKNLPKYKWLIGCKKNIMMILLL